MSSEDKSEAATPKRRSEARSRGQVAKSMEISSMTVMLGILLSLHGAVSHAAALIRTYFEATLAHLNNTNIDPQGVMQLAGSLVSVVAQAVGPLLLTAMALGVVVNIAQTGPMWAMEGLRPDFNKLNPLNGLKRFVSPRSLVDLVKSLYKIGIVGGIAYSTIQGSYAQLLVLPRMEVGQGLGVVMELAYSMALRIVMTMLVLAALDYAYQRYSTEKSMKMSKEEVRQEFKNAEGSPQMKGRIRARQREMAKKRMMAEVPGADAIVTNPTHFAVALKYDPTRMNAPIIVAMGMDLMALKIRELGRDNDVPIIENPPLARTLYKHGKIGREIPGDLYEAVAEVLAFVYQINQKRRERRGGSTHI